MAKSVRVIEIPSPNIPSPCTSFSPDEYHPNSHNISLRLSCRLEESAPEMSAKEAGLVILVLLLWICAILLFIDRWGKIRMLEPYMPAFKTSGLSDVTNQSTRMNSLEENGGCCVISTAAGGCTTPAPARPRQNSLLMSMPSVQQSSVRRVKSAVDLVSLVMAEQREATAEQRRSRFQRRGHLLTFEERRRPLHEPRNFSSTLTEPCSGTSTLVEPLLHEEYYTQSPLTEPLLHQHYCTNSASMYTELNTNTDV